MSRKVFRRGPKSVARNKSFGVWQKKLPREDINTAIAALALVVSGVTAWFQFAPESDNIQILSAGRVVSNIQIKINNSPIPLPNDAELSNTVGPILWKVVIFNPTSHNTPIIDEEIIYAHPKGLIKSNAMYNGVFDEKLQELHFPITIPAHEAKSIIVSVTWPMKSLRTSEEQKCADRTNSFEIFQSCLFDQGRDLFGNSGSRTAYGKGFSWKGKPIEPLYWFRFRTAAGFDAAAPLINYPTAVSQAVP